MYGVSLTEKRLLDWTTGRFSPQVVQLLQSPPLLFVISHEVVWRILALLARQDDIPMPVNSVTGELLREMERFGHVAFRRPHSPVGLGPCRRRRRVQMRDILVQWYGWDSELGRIGSIEVGRGADRRKGGFGLDRVGRAFGAEQGHDKLADLDFRVGHGRIGSSVDASVGHAAADKVRTRQICLNDRRRGEDAAIDSLHASIKNVLAPPVIVVRLRKSLKSVLQPQDQEMGEKIYRDVEHARVLSHKLVRCRSLSMRVRDQVA